MEMGATPGLVNRISILPLLNELNYFKQQTHQGISF
jgi:hypothetical protein